MKMTLSRALPVFLVACSAAGPSISAELPSHKATPPAAVRNCEIDGKPGYRLPDSDVCLKLGGYVSGQISTGSITK
jgi:Porin subfamily